MVTFILVINKADWWIYKWNDAGYYSPHLLIEHTTNVLEANKIVRALNASNIT